MREAKSMTPADGVRKGLPWTEEEHRLFLKGLETLGKGNWRGISRVYVTTRSPTQVASHAQKYFLRQGTGTKRRSRFTSLEEQHPVRGGGITSPADSGGTSANTLGSSPPAIFESKRASTDSSPTIRPHPPHTSAMMFPPYFAFPLPDGGMQFVHPALFMPPAIAGVMFPGMTSSAPAAGLPPTADARMPPATVAKPHICKPAAHRTTTLEQPLSVVAVLPPANPCSHVDLHPSAHSAFSRPV